MRLTNSFFFHFSWKLRRHERVHMKKQITGEFIFELEIIARFIFLVYSKWCFPVKGVSNFWSLKRQCFENKATLGVKPVVKILIEAGKIHYIFAFKWISSKKLLISCKTFWLRTVKYWPLFVFGINFQVLKLTLCCQNLHFIWILN